MKLRRMIKKRARSALNGNRGSAVALIMIYIAVGAVINMVDASALRLLGYEFTMHTLNIYTYSSNFFYDISAIAVSVVAWVVRMALVVPLTYGMLNWYLELTDRRKHGAMHIFWPYESKAAFRGVLLSINIFIKTTIAAFLLLLLPVALIVMSTMQNFSYALSATLGVSGAVILVLALILLWAFVQRFAIARILLCEKYQLTVHQAVKASVRYTQGHRFELVRLELSFLPWALPLLASTGMMAFSLEYDHYSAMPFIWTCIFILVSIVTYFMLTPYYTMVRVMYGRYLYEYGIWQENGAQPVVQPETVSDSADSYKAEESVEISSEISSEILESPLQEQYNPPTEDNTPETSSDGEQNSF